MEELEMKMTPKQLYDFLVALWRTPGKNMSVIIEGPPGIGKTAIPKQAAEDLGMEIFIQHPPLLESVDLRGVPVPDLVNEVTRWLPPIFLPGVEKVKPKTNGKATTKPQIKDKKQTLFLIDEMRQAPTSVQNAFSQLIWEGRCGEYMLPPGVRICATSNRMQDKAGTYRMPSHLVRRFVHIELYLSIQDWTVWALHNDVETEIIAFLNAYPACLMDFDPSSKNEIYACPASWGEHVDMLLKTQMSPDLQEIALVGAVGNAAANQFIAFRRLIRTVADPDEVIKNPTTIPLPDEASSLYAMCTAVAFRATKDNIGQIVKFAARLGEEYEIMMLQFVNQHTSVSRTKEFRGWYQKHADTLFGSLTA